MVDDSNRDPAQEPQAGKRNPGLGAGLGAVGGGVAGAALGAVAGPPGMVFGATVGAVAGGLVGAGDGDRARVEELYWRDHYRDEPYIRSGHTYEDYSLAYRTGYEGRSRHPGRSFDEVEAELRGDYERERGDSRLDWDDARHATRAAWHRVEGAMPGDADGDGR